MSAGDFFFENRPRDISPTVLSVDGALPKALRGRFVANGPGQSEVGNEKLHVFDAHGRVLAVEFGDSGATLRGRHVETPLLGIERAQNKTVKRRVFSNKPSRWSNLFDLDFANNCMHNAYAFAGHVIAAQDPGHFVLDPETLSVQQALDFDGLLKKGTTVTPMPRVDPSTGNLIAWLQKPGPRDRITIVELDPSLHVAAKRVCKLPAGLMHDVAFTQDYYLVARFAGLDLPKVLWGAEPVSSAFRFEEKFPELHLIPRDGSAPKIVKLPNRVHFHYFNAFQEGDTLVVDTIGYAGAVNFRSLYPPGELERIGLPFELTPRPQVVRYRISLDTWQVDERVMPDIACEAPAINPQYRGKAYRYGYAAARGTSPGGRDPWGVAWFDGLGKLDFESNEATVWQAEEGCICSPPAFIADDTRSGEDAGFLLTWIQDPARGRSSAAVFDAQNLGNGPVATAHASELFGVISHTDFLPQAQKSPR